MQKFYRNLFAAGVVSLGLAACGDDVTVTPPPAPPTAGVTSVTVAPATQTIALQQEVAFAASVVAGTGVGTSVTWSTSNGSIASVSAAGVVKGLSVGTTTIIATSDADNGKTGIATVTVVPNPPGVVSFNPGVANVSITIGTGTGTAQAIIQMLPGVTAPTISWTSLNTSVVTLGTVTQTATGANVVLNGVAPGTGVVRATATVDGVTVSANVVVTVVAQPSISISDVTANIGGVVLPVNINNVMGQIEVTLNFNPREQAVDSIVVYIDSVGASSTKSISAATQGFASGYVPAAGDITFSIQTARFTKNPATGTAKVSFLNGPTTIRAAIYPKGATGAGIGGVVNCSQPGNNPVCASPKSIVLNNMDAWAADLTPPSRASVLGVGGTNVGQPHYGGPGATGIATATLYPVIYTPGRSISAASWGVTGCTAAQATGIRTFGAVGAGANNSCTYENTVAQRDNVVVNSALDNLGLPYPTNLIANIVINNSTPDSLRLDWAGPTVTAPTVVGAEGFNWMNNAWAFKPGGTIVFDNGVGPLASSWAAFLGGAYTVAYTTPAGGGPALAETNTNTAVDGYTMRASATDLLTNPANSAVTGFFGVDNTVPSIRYSATAAPSSFPSTYTAGGSTAVTDSTTYNAVEGTYGVNAGAVATGNRVQFLAAAAGTNDSVRTESIDNRSGLSRAILTSRRFAQGGATGTTTSLGCANSAGAYGIGLIDGWRPAPQQHVFCGSALPGYYTTSQTAVDRAGNVSTTYKRTVALDPGQPVVTGVSPNGGYVANASANFTIGTSDDLEVIDARFRMHYPNLTQGDAAGPFTGAAMTSLVWDFGTLTPFATRFDNSIIDPIVPVLASDLLTVSVQETCLAATVPVASCVYRGDPISTVAIPVAKPDSVAVMTRDVWGSFIANFVAGAATGVSTETAALLIPATLPATGSYSVAYDASGACPAGGIVGGNCVTSTTSGNFRHYSTVGSSVTFRATENESNTLPVFTRVDFFGLSSTGQWVFLKRITVPAVISTLGTPIVAGNGTITGTDSGLERYWDYTFTTTGLPAAYTNFRALGVNASGFGLFSTRSTP